MIKYLYVRLSAVFFLLSLLSQNTAAQDCSKISSGVATFAPQSINFLARSAGQLDLLQAQMHAQPACRVVLCGGGNGSKNAQQASWDHVNTIMEYLSSRFNIDRNRFIFQYGQPGDVNGVIFRPAAVGEEGPANVPPPFPNLRMIAKADVRPAKPGKIVSPPKVRRL